MRRPFWIGGSVVGALREAPGDCEPDAVIAIAQDVSKMGDERGRGVVWPPGRSRTTPTSKSPHLATAGGHGGPPLHSEPPHSASTRHVQRVCVMVMPRCSVVDTRGDACVARRVVCNSRLCWPVRRCVMACLPRTFGLPHVRRPKANRPSDSTRACCRWTTRRHRPEPGDGRGCLTLISTLTYPLAQGSFVWSHFRDISQRVSTAGCLTCGSSLGGTAVASYGVKHGRC